jgi:predicted ATP-grasp superfamily ATP-dependent carboligase
VATVLVSDGEQRAALAVVRSLGRAGHTVYVCSAAGRSLAGASRHCRDEARTGDPLRSPEEFAAQVRLLVERWGVEVLLPISEASLLALLPARHSLGDALLPFPGEEEFARICDKALLMEVARELGIGIPAQLRLEAPAAAERLDDGALPRFPLVLKPARSVIAAEGARVKTTVVHLADRAELDAALASLPSTAYPVLLQERIEGPGVGVFLLLWEGELLASFSHRRVREKPPSGGVSVYRESVAPDPGLLARSRALLDAFGWTGVAMVEYKVDSRTGIPYLMEVNGRFWGSLQLAVDAGVDFPALLLAAALGERPSAVHNYRAGVRSRWWWGDVDHLLARLRRSGRELALPAGSPGRLRASLDFLAAFGQGARNEVFRLDDPLPSLRETIDWVRGR